MRRLVCLRRLASRHIMPWDDAFVQTNYGVASLAAVQDKTVISDLFPGSERRLSYNVLAGRFDSIMEFTGSNFLVDTLESFVSVNHSLPDVDEFASRFSPYGLYVMASMAVTLCNLREKKADDTFDLSRLSSICFLSKLRKLFRCMNAAGQESVRSSLADLHGTLAIPENVFDDDNEFTNVRKQVFSFAHMKKLYLVFCTVAFEVVNYTVTVDV